MPNEFLDLISSPLMNLDHTYRYSGTKLVEAESLSQHIVETIMLGLKIIDKVNHIAGYKLIDSQAYVMKAVYHDLEEVITGDIPRPLKYYSEDTKNSLKHVADEIAAKFFSTQFYEGYEHYSLWDNAKLGNEGKILKIVDMLVVANKVVKEVSLLHNYYMLRVAHEVSQYLKELSGNMEYFKEPDVDNYLASIVIDAVHTMEKLIEDNKETMDSLNIYSQSMI